MERGSSLSLEQCIIRSFLFNTSWATALWTNNPSKRQTCMLYSCKSLFFHPKELIYVSCCHTSSLVVALPPQTLPLRILLPPQILPPLPHQIPQSPHPAASLGRAHLGYKRVHVRAWLTSKDTTRGVAWKPRLSSGTAAHPPVKLQLWAQPRNTPKTSACAVQTQHYLASATAQAPQLVSHQECPSPKLPFLWFSSSLLPLCKHRKADDKGTRSGFSDSECRLKPPRTLCVCNKRRWESETLMTTLPLGSSQDTKPPPLGSTRPSAIHTDSRREAGLVSLRLI